MNAVDKMTPRVAGHNRWLNSAWPRAALNLENLLLSLALGLMILLPLTEITLRWIFATGIEGSTPLVQHLTLVVSMLGAAVAARENKLLALSSTSLFQQGKVVRILRLCSSAVSAAVCLFLAISSVEFLLTERAGGRLLAYAIPVWMVQLVLPAGFTLIGVRLLLHASTRISGRWYAAGLAAVMVMVAALLPIAPAETVIPGILVLAVATVFGAPIFVTIGGTALLLFWGQGTPVASIALDHYRLVVNPSLPAIPLFTVAGYFLAESGAPRRLVRVFKALFGRMRGGAVIVSVLVCTFFTSFTGASGVTILALGGILMPLLLTEGYSRKPSLGLITAGGAPGVLLLPALPLILYAVVANVGIQQMFTGALIPAGVMFAITAGWGVAKCSRELHSQPPFNWQETRLAIAAAKWELLLPLVPVGAIFSGLATPVESAALTAFYAFLIETWVHRDLKLASDIPRVMTQSGLLVGGIILILGVALGFTNFLTDARVPDQALEWVTGSIESPWIFLLALNLFLLLVGCIMDIYSAIVVLTPLIVPIGLAFGIDPIHLGVIFLANMELGFLTPPVGMNLFFASSRFDIPMPEVYRSVIPLFFVLCVGVLVITYVPVFSTWLPGVMR